MRDSNEHPPGALEADRQYQAGILPAVSRTFALTIPALPDRLALVVTNAYLLCRIADTVEDDPQLAAGEKEVGLGRFLIAVKGEEDAAGFSAAMAPRLAPETPEAERELMRNVARVVAVTHSFSDAERRILERCVSVMCVDMPKFQRNSSLAGLRDLAELDAYCYAVAGVAGEMLTDLFCIHCPELAPKREELRKLAVSFGQGLQMTNILKDIWDDHERGACWLPRSEFDDGRLELAKLPEIHLRGEFQQGLQSLIAVAHGHLVNALEFTCHLPGRERGMRRFCLWALGLAVLSLQKLRRNSGFTASDQVKVSRRSVRATVLATNLLVSNNPGLRGLFRFAARGLPR